MQREPQVAGQALKRLFLALPCTPEQSRTLGRWRSTLGLKHGRPVPVSNFHLTLMFLGEIGAAQLPAICDAMAKVPRPDAPLRIVLDTLALWHRSNMLVLEPSQTPAALRQLVYALHQALLPFGIEDSLREFRPHLTLVHDYPGDVPESSEAPALRLNIEHFTLFESTRGQYTPIAQWPLMGSNR